jgi:hypothetical protein
MSDTFDIEPDGFDTSHTHTTKGGRTILIKDMTDPHLLNTIAFIKRRAKEGVLIRRGGGTTAEDIWYDEEYIYGAEALDHLNFNAYVAEARRRNLHEY